MTPLAEAIAGVRARIDAACSLVGRDPAGVRLLAISKTHALPILVHAVAAGCTQLGESRVQEVVEKARGWSSAADGLPAPEWVLIGHLQRNKVRDVASLVAEFQALDSLELAEALDRRLQAAGRGLRVLVQVNTSGEASKFGLAPDEVVDFARRLSPFSSLVVDGLMTIATRSDDPADADACFTTLRELQTRLRDEAVLGSSWDELSMGMSGDLEQAIAHGSTTVRVGTAIFGRRG
ncbi:YggS family pyridoxal phosphate-dependent enzyme [Aestuariimicrobium soli]|uniref:YggS family pyridoxal phosphate-dependent enzyme n=1 Tax=Aestuariimicrobium soli TaxID=2035834 RepID=UPI003EBF9FA8